jgi:predicted PurR-regulated permease PerM
MMSDSMTTIPSEQEPVTKPVGPWRNLLNRIKSVTPSLLARAILSVGVLASLAWLISSTWPAILPFLFGAVVAYIVLPLVNWLDKFLPRVLAIILTLTSVVGLIIWFLWMIFPVIGAELTRVYFSVPSM